MLECPVSTTVSQLDAGNQCSAVSVVDQPASLTGSPGTTDTSGALAPSSGTRTALSVLRNIKYRGFKRYQGEILYRLRAETEYICIFGDLVMGKIFSGGDS